MNGTLSVKGTGNAAKASERGSALLIVFVFAAMVAIMLYTELPVAVFEAQRQKEQLLIDRGDEYAHAVKLFVRKLGTYPASIEALEKTNQMRFLRHRFKDPFTGKDDWRLLHAGPNGTLIDSKVNPIEQGQNGTGNNSGAARNGSSTNTGFGAFANNANSASNSTFGSAGTFGSNGSGSDSAPPEVVVPQPPQRPPAVAANGSAQVAASPPSDQNPMLPLLPAGQAEANRGGPSNGVGTAQQGTSPGQTAVPGQTDAGGDPRVQNGGLAGANSAVAGNGNVSPNGLGQGTVGANLGAGNSGIGAGGGMGRINSGGIAGVASKAAGRSIKTYNDQTDYSLWEFFYDPTKDAARGLANAMGGAGAAQQTNPQQNGFGQTQQQNGVGQNQQNGFGTNGSFGSGNSFGTSSGFGGNTASPGNTAPPTNTGPGTGLAPSPGVTPQQQ